MSNVPANRPQTTLANKPATMPALGPGQPLTLRPKTMEEAMRLADMVAKSSFCPKSFRDREGRGIAGDILIVVLQCEELDITLLQGLSGIAVINGTPKIWGDLGPALIKRSGLEEYFVDDWDEASQTAVVRIKRKGKPAREFTFSWDDACKARLDVKDTYKLFRKDMCTWRAKTRAMRTEFPDVLKGMAFVEDALGMPETAVEPEPIRMPRELAQAAPTEKPEAKCSLPSNHFPPEPPENNGDGDPVQIFVAKADEKEYTDKKTGKPRKYFVIEFSDGQIANTFSESLANVAFEACPARLPVSYTVVAGRKYTDAEGVERQGWNLDTLTMAKVPEGGKP